MILKVAKILANVVPNYPFAPKQNIFLESWLTSLLLIPSSYSISNKSLELIITHYTYPFAPLCYLTFEKYPCPWGDFLGKMIVTFAYLLYPIIPPKISKRPLEGIMIFKVVKLLANVDPNYPFTTKQNILWEIWLLLLSTYCVVSYYNTLKFFSENRSSDKAA